MQTQDLTRMYCPWMAIGGSLQGMAEVPGPKTAGFIAAMLKGLHAWWGDDETPWCGVFVAHCLQAAGLPLAKEWWRARGWQGYGRSFPLSTSSRDIPYGALVVLDRPPRPRDGHVGFFAGRVERSDWRNGGVSLLGGNQGNAVRYASFPRDRVVYWAWPGDALPVTIGRLLVAKGNGLLHAAPAPSTGEA